MAPVEVQMAPVEVQMAPLKKLGRWVRLGRADQGVSMFANWDWWSFGAGVVVGAVGLAVITFALLAALTRGMDG